MMEDFNKNKLALIGLNELNFDFIKYYINKGLLPNFKILFNTQSPIETESESEYRLLEPWIQWMTVYSGKNYKDHKILRLGDIVDRKDITQIFEEIESKGKKVGAISPFNADNRLKNPSFFILDPWTKTKVSGNFMIKSIYNAVHQAVNDNSSGKLKFKSIFGLALGFIRYVPFYRYIHYFKLIFSISKPGSKAIILDSLLSDVFVNLLKSSSPDFSNLFLNSGAHIQHHYMFNSDAYTGSITNPNWYCPKKYDPLIRILKEYDHTLGRLLKISNLKIIVATALHQEAHQKITFYWRLNQHEIFLKRIGLVNYSNIIPRMSRDFLIKFSNKLDAENAETLLNSFLMSTDSLSIFKVDNRVNSLFVELIYSKEINESDFIISNKFNKKIDFFKKYISFVAIKNGEHDGTGYLTSNFTLKNQNKIKLSSLKDLIISEL